MQNIHANRGIYIGAKHEIKLEINIGSNSEIGIKKHREGTIK